MSYLIAVNRIFRVQPIIAAAAMLWGIEPASAHVKWFCAYDIAGRPDGLDNVLCQDFELLTCFAIGALLLGYLVEQTFIGDAMGRALDRICGDLHANSDTIIRATFGFFLISLWSVGGIILTPELKTAAIWVPLLQLAMAVSLLWHRTMLFAAAGIVVLFGYGIANYGIFHLLDYPIFLGLAAYLAATGLKRDIFRLSPLDVLRWSVAITLMWASVEKWAFPEWSYPLFITHPAMAMGYEPEFFMRAAGVVEFTLAFALMGPPLVRRMAALMLTATFVSAIVEFGKLDAIGHAPIIAALLAIFAGKSAAPERRWTQAWTVMPLQYGCALAVFIALYYGIHAMSYGPVS